MELLQVLLATGGLNPFIFNKHKVCLNPHRFEYKTKGMEVSISVAHCTDGWVYGFSHTVNMQGNYGGGGYGCSSGRWPHNIKYRTMQEAFNAAKEAASDLLVRGKENVPEYLNCRSKLFSTPPKVDLYSLSSSVNTRFFYQMANLRYQ